MPVYTHTDGSLVNQPPGKKSLTKASQSSGMRNHSSAALLGVLLLVSMAQLDAFQPSPFLYLEQADGGDANRLNTCEPREVCLPTRLLKNKLVALEHKTSDPGTVDKLDGNIPDTPHLTFMQTPGRNPKLNEHLLPAFDSGQCACRLKPFPDKLMSSSLSHYVVTDVQHS